MSDETTKYVYANIRIPIKIQPDQSFELINDRMQIEFEKCDQLPDPIEGNHRGLLDKLLSASNMSNVENATVDPENDETIPPQEETIPPQDVVLNSTQDNITQDMMKVFSSDYDKKTPKKRQNSSFKKRRACNQYTRRNYVYS